MTDDRAEGAGRKWQDVVWYGITWAGWIGLLFALHDCSVAQVKFSDGKTLCVGRPSPGCYDTDMRP